ncbi:MAG: SdpI family protein [Usitatibacter sp.]
MLITILLLIACAIIAAASAPLALKLIPPNEIYGLPTRKMRSQPDNWVRVNVFAGKALLAASGVTALLLMVYAGTWLKSGWLQVLLFLIAYGAAISAAVAYERRVPMSNHDPVEGES